MAEDGGRGERQQRLAQFVEKLRSAGGRLDVLRQLAGEAFAETDPALRAAMISAGAEANPLAVPELGGASNTVVLTLDAWRKCVSMARMQAANSSSTRVLVSGAPKSASTFITAKIAKAYGLPYRSLMLYADQPYFHQAVGASDRAQEIDELALLGYCFYPAGFAAHHHIQYTDYLARQLKLYGVLAVRTQRNIFDCLVSYDDHLFKNTGWKPGSNVTIAGFPVGWHEMGFDDRIAILIDKLLMWYIDYYASWARAEKAGIIDPVCVDYQQDTIGEPGSLAQRIADRLGEPKIGMDAFVSELSQKNERGTLFNAGVSGRGEAITGANRSRILDTFHRFRSLGDFSAVTD